MLNKSKLVRLGVIALLSTLAAAMTVAGVYAAAVTLNIKGSTTVYPIVSSAISQFQSNSAHMIGSGNNVVINLEPAPGSGSGGGLSAICADPTTTHVAMASRAIRSSDCAAGGTYTATDFVPTTIARDALAVIVRTERTVTCVRKSQLINIYSNTSPTMTWAMLGDTSSRASDLVVPRARILDSGTRQSFIDFIGVTSPTEASVINATGLPRLQGNPDVVSALKAAGNYEQLGYVGMGFLDDTAIKGVSYDAEDGSGCIAPTDANVLNNTYKMARDLYLYTLDQSKWPGVYPALTWQAINAYTGWMKGPFGQRWVVHNDFVMVQRPAMDLNNSGNIDGGDYVVLGLYWQKRWGWFPY